ncbi:MAG: GumC family protein [Gammaproteobacteria bacterium]
MLDWKSIGRAIRFEKQTLAAVTLAILLLGAYAIMSLPNMYVSSAQILVERRGLFSETEMTATAQDNLSRRMHAITSTVLSSDSIRTILIDNDLVTESISDEDFALAVDSFREDVVLELDNVAVVNQFTGKSGMYSQGMIIEFAHTDPDVAFAISRALTDRVLAANKGKGEAAVEYRREFLSEQRERAFEKLSVAKGAVAEFKNENALFVPEVHPLTIRRYEEIESQTSRIDENLARLRRDLSDVRGALATTSADAFVLAADGTRILGTDEQLRLLEAEYARAKARYTDNHPELVKLRSELEGLRRYSNGGDRTGIQADLQTARRELAGARQRYGAEHPDVRSLTRKVGQLESLLASASTSSPRRTTSESSNPAYNRLLIRERGIVDNIAREGQKQRSLGEELATIKDQLARMPAVEQSLATLLQRQDAATATYEEIESELEQVSLSVGMRQADLLDRFVLIEPPRKAFAPAKPPKKLLLALLGMLSVCAGLLAAILLHTFRDRIIDSDDVEDMLDLPVYIIPRFG